MILVAKASSHVGRFVASRLASARHNVVAMVRDIHAASRGLPSGIALCVADDENGSALKRTFVGIDDMVPLSGDSGSNIVVRYRPYATKAIAATDIRHIPFTSIVEPPRRESGKAVLQAFAARIASCNMPLICS